MKKYVRHIIILLLMLCACKICFAQQVSVIDSPLDETRIIKTKHCTVYLAHGVDAGKVDKRLKIRFRDIFLSSDNYVLKKGTSEEKIGEKVSRIFQKVEQVLDMYPRRMKLSLKIYANQAELNEVFYEIMGKKNIGKEKAFYVHRFETIYTTQRAITANILAHEMGHAVCDHYFLIKPPQKVRELMSQYAEYHLED